MPRVLIADDNPLSLRFLTAALEVCGCACSEAEDGAAALAQAQAAAFDLLLLDARMPRLGGAAMLVRLRAQAGPSQHSPALATTADEDADIHARLCAAGFAEVLVKPLAVQALRAALARHLPHAPPTVDADDALDDRHALAAAGGDPAIVAALRGLLASELEALPDELAGIGARRDAVALRERLHRLDASAGFCGVPALLRAAASLRVALDAPVWPVVAVSEFLASCARARARLEP